MTEPSGTSEAWTEAWTAAQKKYMDAWLAMASASTGNKQGAQKAGAAASDPLAEGLAFWTQMMGPALPAQARDLSQKLAEFGQGYMKIGENLWKVLHGAQAAASTGSDWEATLRDQLHKLKENFTASAADPWAGLATLWGSPLQHWRRLASSFSVLPGNLERSLRGEGPLGTEALQRELSDALSLPAIGYMREWQMLAQEWGRYSLEHAQAVQAYETTLAKVGSRAFDLLTTKLLAMAKDDAMVDSVRAAYDLWVDCAEEAYADVASGDEFPRIQARLTNTLMALKRHEQQMVEELQAAMNMPSRRELNTTHGRVQGLRRELRELQRQVEDLGLAEVHEKLDALRDDLRVLQAAISTAGSSSAPEPGRKAQPRRRAATRDESED